MAEYIEKQAAQDAIKREWDGCGGQYEAWAIIKDTCDAIDELPPADVRPVIRGHWTNEERVGFGSVEAECSNCGRRMIHNPAWICCPWCMADMQGGDAK